jgi:hypothetical protein
MSLKFNVSGSVSEIQFNFQKNTQIPSVKVCILFLADPVFATAANVKFVLSLEMFIRVIESNVGIV